ncbi:MAG: rhomboid family intramembrane serine protease [Spirochaetales bacterium]|nr:rhomboid family intramembrane serine protease [Spirochaetales bacterium]
MKIRYNSPVILTYALLASAILLIDQLAGTNITVRWCTVPGRGAFDWGQPLMYLRLVSHVIGHINWQHLVSNFAFILLLGPILEEKYGSFGLFGMMLATALITGLLNVLLFSTGLLGASGIVFMLILLISFTNIRNGEIPLTFILILALYLASEIINIFRTDEISQFAHIAGGFCGSLFGFLKPRRR